MWKTSLRSVCIHARFVKISLCTPGSFLISLSHLSSSFLLTNKNDGFPLSSGCVVCVCVYVCVLIVDVLFVYE
jgi:hypothetical protein